MTDKQKYYIFNGKMFQENEPCLLPFDLGLLRGYGIFDFFRVIEDKPIFIEDHFDRFYTSADAMHLAVPYSRAELLAQMRELIAKNDMGYSGIKIVLTGGYSTDGYTPSTPNVILIHNPLTHLSEELYQKGIKLLLVDFVRESPTIKTLNYNTAIRTMPKLAEENASDVLFVKDGILSESARSNLFLVKGEKIITPISNVLMGITRKNIIRVSSEHYEIEERDIHVDELNEVDEAFISSSTKAVLPVVQVNDISIGEGRPGPVSNKIKAHFADYLESYISSRR